MPALIKRVDTKLEGITQEELSAFVNMLKEVHVDMVNNQQKTREEHAKMYVPTLVKTEPGANGRASITMALPDSGNLLAHAAIYVGFHEQLGILIEDTKIWARAANKQALEIQGVSKGIYLRFPNVAKTLFVNPLVVKNLSCKLNLGAQFNLKTGLIPQWVISGENGKKTNFSKLDGIRIRLQFQDVSNRTLQRTVGDPEFLQ